MGARFRKLKMPTANIKKLEALKEQKKILQEKEDKIKSEIISELSTFLIDAQAIDINFDILMGGILDVIEKANQGDKITEAWKLSGEKFRQGQKKRNTQKNTSAPKKVKKGKGHDK
jgi:hypothetical protein